MLERIVSDVWSIIINFFSVCELIAVQETSKKLLNVLPKRMHVESLWSRIYLHGDSNNFPGWARPSYSPPVTLSWKQRCLSRQKIEQNWKRGKGYVETSSHNAPSWSMIKSYMNHKTRQVISSVSLYKPTYQSQHYLYLYDDLESVIENKKKICVTD